MHTQRLVGTVVRRFRDPRVILYQSIDQSDLLNIVICMMMMIQPSLPLDVPHVWGAGVFSARLTTGHEVQLPEPREHDL